MYVGWSIHRLQQDRIRASFDRVPARRIYRCEPPHGCQLEKPKREATPIGLLGGWDVGRRVWGGQYRVLVHCELPEVIIPNVEPEPAVQHTYFHHAVVLLLTTLAPLSSSYPLALTHVRFFTSSLRLLSPLHQFRNLLGRILKVACANTSQFESIKNVGAAETRAPDPSD